MPNSKKDKYRQLCTEKSIPLFLQAWWMDSVCTEGKAWDVLLFEKKGAILGALPYHFTNKFGFKLILQPQLTQYNGVWIDYPNNQTSVERYSLEQEVCSALIAQLEGLELHHYEQNFAPSFTNWQAFYWKGYSQTTRYSYIINNIADTEKVYENFHLFKKKHIRKAEAKYTLELNLGVEEFYNFHKQAYSQLNKNLFYSKQFLTNLCNTAITKNQGKIIAIKDGETILSAMFVVWDAQAGYYLISAIDPRYRSTGASILMVWEAIKFLSNKTQSFDFEGSMIEGVAKANQEFGAVQQAYFYIQKTHSSLFSFLMKIKNRTWK